MGRPRVLRPQLRRDSLGARAIPLKRLFVLLTLAACAGTARAPSPRRLCYALQWEDTSWAHLLPSSVELDQARDTLLPSTYGYRLLKPVHPGDSTGWVTLMNAWWVAPTTDSLVIMLDGVDSGWRARLRLFGDSLGGIAYYWGGNDGQKPMSVHGRRVACPALREAGA